MTLGPHNTVFRGETAVALIDWNGELGPGRRAVDFAHAVWCFADLTEAGVPVEAQARRTELMCRANPGMTPAVVVDELTARFPRACSTRGRRTEAGGGGVRAAPPLDGRQRCPHRTTPPWWTSLSISQRQRQPGTAQGREGAPRGGVP